MRIDLISIFPDIFTSVFAHGIIRRALAGGLLQISSVNLRDFATDKHHSVDDRPFGGGEGMVFKPEPLAAAIRSLSRNSPEARVINMSPRGVPLSAQLCRSLAGMQHLIVICGRYEGIDQRIIDHFVHQEISIGDYVVSGGEIPAMVLVDGICRLLPGAVGHPDSTRNESFENGLLDCPVYTRPVDFEGHPVPDVLLSGNHHEISLWRKAQSRHVTLQQRPDIFEKE